ncbi:M16 family metallopeptidase [Virgisporangium aurantiacum]|uniref:Peptidase M16 n=1 Tax=Virgisporangium aurantiacum TaxID=175570 RepID=A0A8J4E164_9ACTN|nr:pitrilysin family protein [Virgisporangium aurantiacum]GIJ58495.1 peptidase M16 [Virgisporangium aurantiacum]
MTQVVERAGPVRHRLANGLRVTVVADRTAPVVGVAVHYGVGFRSEPEGRSGFAHLFEHLMFQGGADLDGDHFRAVEGVGGRCNASTRQDYTDFHTVAPADALAHLLSLEAGRMRAPRITARAIRAQAAVVTEEILTKTQRPYGGFPWPLISPVLFRTYPNAHDGYGDHTALADVSVRDCEEFFARHYGPGNAVLTVTGDVDTDRTLDLVETFFGGIAARPAPPAGSWWEPEPTARREEDHRDAFAALPAVALGYRVPDPAAGLRPLVALAVLADVLVGGPRPRLAARMRDSAGPLSARCGLFDFADARDPELWMLTAVHRPGAGREVVAAVDEDLHRLATDGPPADELAQAVGRRVNAHHRAMDQLANRVRALGRFAVLFDDPGLADALVVHYGRSTVDDVAAAARSLAHDRRAVLTLTPASAGESAAGEDAR